MVWVDQLFDETKIKYFYQVLDILKTFNVYIHLGCRLDDLELAEVELNRLFKAKLIEKKVYLKSLTIIEEEIRKEKNDG